MSNDARKNIKGNISEIYTTLQGEGIWVGVPMVFLRMLGCHRRCKYCDTGYALVAKGQVRVWRGWRKGNPLILNNPLTVDEAFDFVTMASGIDEIGRVVKWVSFTGGEPLLQVDFLLELGLKLRVAGYKILLETEGGLPDELSLLLPVTNAVAADIKLPSTTGEPLNWENCERTLRVLADADAQSCIKIVVTPDIDEKEFLRAVTLIADARKTVPAKELPLILQPVTPARFVRETPSMETLLKLTFMGLEKGLDVRVVWQNHKLVGLP